MKINEIEIGKQYILKGDWRNAVFYHELDPNGGRTRSINLFGFVGTVIRKVGGAVELEIPATGRKSKNSIRVTLSPRGLLFCVTDDPGRLNRRAAAGWPIFRQYKFVFSDVSKKDRLLAVLSQEVKW